MKSRSVIRSSNVEIDGGFFLGTKDFEASEVEISFLHRTSNKQKPKASVAIFMTNRGKFDELLQQLYESLVQVDIEHLDTGDIEIKFKRFPLKVVFLEIGLNERQTEQV